MPRNANLQLEKLVGRQSLTVRVPRELTEKDFTLVGKSIIEIIRRHTGCACLSGVIDVIVTGDFVDPIRVDLGG